MAIFRVGQQHAGEEGTKAHGYARHLHQPGGSHHHQQCGSRGQIGLPGFRHGAEHRPQQVASADHHHRDAADDLQQVGQIAAGHGFIGMRTKERNHGDQRNCRDVLEQQDGEGQPAIGCGQLFTLGENLQTEGGG
ncbi:hypothetical protein D3C78_691690 [compost metagenome]